MQHRTRRRQPIAEGITDRLQRQRAEEAAARARVAADAAALNAAPALERASAEQPDDWRTEERRRQNDAAEQLLRY